MPDADTSRLQAGEVVALGAAAAVAIVAYASLQLADLHRMRLSMAVVLALLLAAVLAGVARRFGGPWPGLTRDRVALGLLLGAGVVAAILTIPGFADGTAAQDPGLYVAEGVQIAHSHSYSFTDPALATHGLPVQEVSPGARFSGVWVRDRSTGLIVPQFFHLQPALLAFGYDLGHFFGLELVTPLCGLVAVLLLVALARRLGGRVAAGAAAVLISVNELQVWQSRSPSSEALAELCWLGCLLALVVAMQTGWRPAAGLAGILVGCGFLDRADGIVGLLLFAGLGAVVLATRQWDGRAWWGLGGAALTLPLGLWQAYAGAVTYTDFNKVPSLPKVAVIVAVVFAVAFAVRLVPLPDVPRALGWVLTVAVAVALGLLYVRPHLQGAILHSTGKGQVARTFDEFNLKRLSWFLGLPIVAAAWLGVARIALTKWSAAAWTVLLGTLAESAIYLYQARNSPQLIFWARRYVPAVLPGFVLLASLAVAYAAVSLSGRWLQAGRVAGVLAVGGTAVWSLVGAVGVRRESEYSGSFAASQRIADAAGPEPGVFLWELAGPCCRTADELLATPVWLERGELSVGMPRSTSPARITYVRDYVQRFGLHHVFVVTPGTATPGELQTFGLTAVLHETGPVTARDEDILHKPTAVRVVPIDVTVWRVDSLPV